MERAGSKFALSLSTTLTRLAVNARNISLKARSMTTRRIAHAARKEPPLVGHANRVTAVVVGFEHVRFGSILEVRLREGHRGAIHAPEGKRRNSASHTCESNNVETNV